jgi:hypothetical protein
MIRMIKSRRMTWAGHVKRKGKKECIQVWVGTSEGKRPLGRTRRKWVDNIKIGLGQIA